MESNYYTWDNVVEIFKINISEVLNLEYDEITYFITSPRFKNKTFRYKLSYSYMVHLKSIRIDYMRAIKQQAIKVFNIDTILGSDIII